MGLSPLPTLAMATKGPQLADKDSVEQLTPKQQKVVTEYVEDPTAQNTELAERADVSRSTVYNVKENYGHILESQLNQRGRDPGKETTDGDPFAGALDKENTPQWITERPHESEPAPEANGQDSGDTTPGVTVHLDRMGVRDVLENRECEHVRAAVVDALVARAFEEHVE